MKDKLFSVFSALALAGVMVAAQEPYPARPMPQPSPQPMPQPGASQAQTERDQVLTGCLIQGSGPTVFLLENAKMSTEVATIPSANPSERLGASSSSGRTYIVSASAGSVDLKGELNHQVSITGVALGWKENAVQ